MARKKKKKLGTFIVLVILIILSVYGGMKGGEYLARKLTKPIGENESVVDGEKKQVKQGNQNILPEKHMVELTAVTTEFLAAEHSKKNDILASLVDSDYYSELLKKNRSLSRGEVEIEYINYKNIVKDRVSIETIFIKNSKKVRETITFKNENNIWRVIKIDR